MTKFEFVREALRKYGMDASSGKASLLDVGCRDCVLKKYVGDLISYKGIDLYQNESGTVDHIVDVEKGIPFHEKEFDHVVALDLLEHLDGFEKALEELLRVTRRRMIINLPNMAHLLHRIRFLKNGQLGAKYRLAYGARQDRHRWITVIPESDSYMEAFASHHGVDLEIYYLVDTPKKRALQRIFSVVGLGAAWWVWSVCYTISRRTSE